jgi:hypothetical protein
MINRYLYGGIITGLFFCAPLLWGEGFEPLSAPKGFRVIDKNRALAESLQALSSGIEELSSSIANNPKATSYLSSSGHSGYSYQDKTSDNRAQSTTAVRSSGYRSYHYGLYIAGLLACISASVGIAFIVELCRWREPFLPHDPPVWPEPLSGDLIRCRAFALQR